ncbi:MAG TPA: TetR/AcrR family transcriptional regulator [Candidatus Limnocylindrales bacterium]|nr:TetR/AcrR family transcriptional regulator [Candidatus Limnocylindrales bacterium]
MPKVTAAHEAAVRERIIEAALRVFAERGFHGATMQDIVRASGLSVGAIYTYFDGKDELFLASCALTSDQAVEELMARLDPAASTAERLAIAVGFFLDSTVDVGPSFDSPSLLVQAWAEARHEPAVRETLVRRREQLVTLSRMLIADGITRGELAAWMDVDATATAATALLDGLILQRIEEGAAFRRQEAERRARAFLDLALAAVAEPSRPSIPSIEPRPFAPAASRISARAAS